ncbi:MAG TPA: hypothetical protein VEJ86_01755 [Candidatus Binataceae bacterium]|nr:hypothetical protein [Candidatus Binataceae bacterium]
MRARSYLAVLAAFLLIAGCSQQSAGPSPAAASAGSTANSTTSINAPTFSDGDQFSIRLPGETASGLQLPADLDLVVKHDGDSPVFASKQTGQFEAGAFTLEFDPRMCVTQSQVNNTLTRYRPCDQSAMFPLATGKTWTARYGISSGGSEFSQLTGTGTVRGIESVTVPAGTFQAYRIDSRHGPADRTTLWYVPEPVGFFVKAQSSSPTELNYELVSYHRASAP